MQIVALLLPSAYLQIIGKKNACSLTPIKMPTAFLPAVPLSGPGQPRSLPHRPGRPPGCPRGVKTTETVSFL